MGLLARMRGTVTLRARGSALLACAILAASIDLNAGSWNQKPGHGQVILTASYFQTSSAFDGSGKTKPFGYGGQFRQILLNPYLEMGLTPRNTLVLNVNAPLLKYWDQYNAFSSAGLGDVEVGVKRRLNRIESAWAVGSQLTVQFPAYPASRNPAPGNHQQDIETRMMLGRGGTWRGHHVFADVESAYRYRSGAPADQFRADITAGIDLTRRIMALAQGFSITSLRNGAPFSITNPNAQSDFDLYKAQFSLVLHIGRGTRIQLGGNDAFAGRNTGGGVTPFLALWKEF